MIPETNNIEEILQQCSLMAISEKGQFQKAFMMAAGIKQLRHAITDEMMGLIMPLMNTSLGFKTDMDPSKKHWKTGIAPTPYSKAVVKDCLIEATLRGVEVTGNQFNIIASNCYVTKEGMTHLLKNLPGLADLRLKFETPKVMDGGGIVEASGTWTFQGVKSGYDPRNFAIKINKSQGVDAIIGKCERKLRKAIYEQITGVNMQDGAITDNQGDLKVSAKVESGSTLEAEFTKAEAKPKEPITSSLNEIRNEIAAYSIGAGPLTAYIVRALGSNKSQEDWTVGEAGKVLEEVVKMKGGK